MIKKYMVILGAALLLCAITSRVSADPVTDPTGDHIGSIDLTSAEAETLTMPDGQTRLKLSINSASNIPGIVVFECDVDNSTGTGGTLSITGIPVTPCPCKTSSGFDIVIMIITRQQDDNSGTAFCSGCTDLYGSCGKGRKPGQWFAATSIGSSSGNIGVLSGLLEPTPWQPGSGKTSDCYGLPWSQILYYAHQELAGSGENFDLPKAQNPANNRWQVSVWYDPAYAPGNQDDFIDGSIFLNISDWLPNGDGNKATMQAGDNLTFCEGNMDYDTDVDMLDASHFKTDYGRSNFKNPCPHCR
jgi:hypothetical protein